jgi:peroxiredoxin
MFFRQKVSTIPAAVRYHFGKENFVKIKPLVFLACVVLLTAYVVRSSTGNHEFVRTGSRAPEFTVRNLEGKEAALSDFRGRLVFLNFWRTDCAPCAAEMPDMEIVSRVFKERRFQMMPVSLDVDEEDVFRFYREHKLTMPSYMDPGDNVSPKFNITGTPETFLIDADGNVVRYYVGQQRWASPEMLAQLERLIPD